MQISLVAPEHVVQLWPKVEPHLREVLASIADTHHPVDIWDRLRSGEYHLWVAHEGAEVRGVTVAYVQAYPRSSNYLCFLIGGDDLGEWKEPMKAAIEAYGRAKGCKKIEGRGRKGWARAIGYEERAVLFEKEL